MYYLLWVSSPKYQTSWILILFSIYNLNLSLFVEIARIILNHLKSRCLPFFTSALYTRGASIFPYEYCSILLVSILSSEYLVLKTLRVNVHHLYSNLKTWKANILRSIVSLQKVSLFKTNVNICSNNHIWWWFCCKIRLNHSTYWTCLTFLDTQKKDKLVSWKWGHRNRWCF